MNRVTIFAPIAALALFAGCGATDVALGDRPQFTDGVNTLTLLVFDGLTGGAISDATVEVHVGPNILKSGKPSGNSYTVAQIPGGTDFPVIVKADDHLTFLGVFNGPGMGDLTDPSNVVYTTKAAVLFPTDAVTSDVEVRVYASQDGTAVGKGTVIATLDPTANGLFGGISGDLTGSLLTGDFEQRPTVIVVPIEAGGLATLPSAKLVYGGTYQIDVFSAEDADGRYLSPNEGGTDEIVIGKEYPSIVIFMGPPAIVPMAITANNEDLATDAVIPSLVVTFPYPVELCGDLTDDDWTNTTPGGVDNDNDNTEIQPTDTNAVNVSISGLTVTLTGNIKVDATGTPVYANDPEDDLSMTFNNVGFQVVGSNDCDDLENIELRGGADVDTEIPVRIIPVP